MEYDILSEIGFTPAEIKVYLSLLKINSCKAGTIINNTGLQSSTVHNTIHSLIDKGFANYTLIGKIKYYHPVNPKWILEAYKRKEDKLKRIIPYLKLIQNKSLDKNKVEFYEGIKGIIALLNILIEETRKGDKYYFYPIDVEGLNEEIQKFFEIYDIKRKSKGLIIKGLARKKLKSLFVKRKFIEMKYLDFPIPSNISICNDKMALFTWGEKPSGILIDSKQIVESQLGFFEELWKIAKK